MRVDRLVTLYLVRPALCYSVRPRHRISILMYHSVAEELDKNVNPYYRTVTSPSAFKQQMEVLFQLNAQVLTLSEALASVSDYKHSTVEPSTSVTSERPSKRLRYPVVITFDDGLRDFYRTAFPIMSAFGFK